MDANYRGELGVVLFNHADDDFHVRQGDRIAQLILEQISTPTGEELQELDETSRGASGFGSIGMQSGSTNGKDTEIPEIVLTTNED